MSGPDNVAQQEYSRRWFGSWAGLDPTTRTAAVVVAIGELTLLPLTVWLGKEPGYSATLFGVMMGAAATQLAALTFWTSLGRDTLSERVMAAGIWSIAIVVAFLAAIGVVNRVPESPQDTALGLSLIGMTVAFAATIGSLCTWMIRQVGNLRLVREFVTLPHSTPRGQFGIKHILLITTVVTIPLVLFRLAFALGWLGIVVSELLLSIGAIASAMVGAWGWMCVVLASSRFLRCVALMITAASFVILTVTLFHFSDMPPADGVLQMLVAYSFTVATLSALQVCPLRVAGYRLQRVTGPAA